MAFGWSQSIVDLRAGREVATALDGPPGLDRPSDESDPWALWASLSEPLVKFPARPQRRTLHVGSVPPSATEALLDASLRDTFRGAYVGCRLVEGVLERTGGVRAFVAFATHEDAAEARERLDPSRRWSTRA